MRKTCMIVCSAFLNKTKATNGNGFTDGQTLFLFNNPIAKWDGDDIYIIPEHSGTVTHTTKIWLNSLCELANVDWRIKTVKFKTVYHKYLSGRQVAVYSLMTKTTNDFVGYEGSVGFRITGDNSPYRHKQF